MTDNNARKIFVRGLSYGTRELALARHIESVAPVDDVHILTTYNGRSKGAAFVTLKDEDKVDEVIEKLNTKPLDGRYLEIQRAKPASELPKTRIVYRYPPGFRPYSRQPFYRQRFHPRGPGYVAPPPAPRAPVDRKKGPNPDRKMSDLTVAVTNLPFVAKEKDMEDIFEGFTILNPKICKTRSGLSKGTAFVTLTSHAEQQRAIEACDSVEVEGRRIHVVEAYLLPEEFEAEKRAVEEAQN